MLSILFSHNCYYSNNYFNPFINREYLSIIIFLFRISPFFVPCFILFRIYLLTFMFMYVGDYKIYRRYTFNPNPLISSVNVIFLVSSLYLSIFYSMLKRILIKTLKVKYTDKSEGHLLPGSGTLAIKELQPPGNL